MGLANIRLRWIWQAVTTAQTYNTVISITTFKISSIIQDPDVSGSILMYFKTFAVMQQNNFDVFLKGDVTLMRTSLPGNVRTETVKWPSWASSFPAMRLGVISWWPRIDLLSSWTERQIRSEVNPIIHRWCRCFDQGSKVWWRQREGWSDDG